MIEEQVSQAVAEKIASETFVFEFHTTTPSFRRKVASTELFTSLTGKALDESTVDHKLISASKLLIDSNELRELGKIYRTFVRYVRLISVPGGLLTLGNNQYLIPSRLLPDLRLKLDEFIHDRIEAMQAFVDAYPSLIEANRPRLGPLFDRSEYPEAEDFTKMFTVQYRFISNAIPEEFEKVSKTLYEQEKQRIQAECAATANLIQAALREQFAELTTSLASKLQNDPETGKPKMFRSGSVERLREFVTVFKDLNLTNDEELNSLVEQTRTLLSGTTAKQLRGDEEFRSHVSSQFSSILENASKLVVPKERVIDFESD